MNFVRYPPLFGEAQSVLPDDFVVSNVDLTATIFDLVGATVPANYTMDGISWLDEVISAVDFNVSSNYANMTMSISNVSCCDYRFIDVKNSRSIVTADYQYIWRANGNVETADGVNTFYPFTYDEQQLYDLNADPDQKVNLITEYESQSVRSDNFNDTLAIMITWFQSMMRDYVDSTCPLADGDGECTKPSFTFLSDISTAEPTSNPIIDGSTTTMSTSTEYTTTSTETHWTVNASTYDVAGETTKTTHINAELDVSGTWTESTFTVVVSLSVVLLFVR